MYKQEVFPLLIYRSVVQYYNSIRYAPIYIRGMQRGKINKALYFFYPGNARACPGINTPMNISQVV